MPSRKRPQTEGFLSKLRSRKLIADLKPEKLLRRLGSQKLFSRLKPPKFDTPDLPPKVKAKLDQGVGKLRRFALTTVKEDYIARMQSRRTGECLRCGLCCKLLFECPFLKNLPDGSSRCRIHGRKPDNCDFFPIDERDLRERDLLDPLHPCGYRFRRD